MAIKESELSLLRDIFIACVESYVTIMSDWVTRGELNDPVQEFFIKLNPKIVQDKKGIHALSSKKQWRDCFVFRTINIKELMQANGFFMPENEELRVEISVPLFLQPIMREILSIGKSIKILRYLDINGTH